MIGKSTAELDFRDNILYSQWDGKSEWSNEEYLKLRKQFRKKRKRCV